MDWLIPDGLLAEHALVAVVAALATALVVLIHCEGVQWLAKRYSGRAIARATDRRAI